MSGSEKGGAFIMLKNVVNIERGENGEAIRIKKKNEQVKLCTGWNHK